MQTRPLRSNDSESRPVDKIEENRTKRSPARSEKAVGGNVSTKGKVEKGCEPRIGKGRARTSSEGGWVARKLRPTIGNSIRALTGGRRPRKKDIEKEKKNESQRWKRLHANIGRSGGTSVPGWKGSKIHPRINTLHWNAEEPGNRGRQLGIPDKMRGKSKRDKKTRRRIGDNDEGIGGRIGWKVEKIPAISRQR